MEGNHQTYLTLLLDPLEIKRSLSCRHYQTRDRYLWQSSTFAFIPSFICISLILLFVVQNIPVNISTTFHFNLRASIAINREHSYQHKYSIPRRKAVHPLIISPVGRLWGLSFDFLCQAFPGTTSKGTIRCQTYADAGAVQT